MDHHYDQENAGKCALNLMLWLVSYRLTKAKDLETLAKERSVNENAGLQLASIIKVRRMESIYRVTWP